MSNDEKNKKIKQLIERGIEKIYPNKEFLEKKLQSGEKLTLYLGIDPTGPTLHMGHAIPLRKLREFQELGHKTILLIGDFTARIGDPTDKADARKQLTAKEVKQNAKLYKKQASSFISFSGPNRAELKYNSKWLGKMKFADVLELASKMTVGQMIERDMFQERIKAERPIFIHEFLYPLMQGYDSVVMRVDGEIGGNDQTFNMLAGRTLEKQMLDKEKFVITMKLLVDTTGKKMGKTEGNMLSFLDTPEEKFGKVMSWTDGMILRGFELCTAVDLEKVEKRLSSGENPRDIKMDLAYEIVRTYHGEAEAKRAREEFVNTFQKGNTPENIEEIQSAPGGALVDTLVEAGVVESKTQARRLLADGAIKIDGEKISEDIKLGGGEEIQVGKKVWVKIK